MVDVAGCGAPPRAATRDAPTGELVTICAECKRVISHHEAALRAEATLPGREPLVSHGLCEACARRLYGSIFNRRA